LVLADHADHLVRADSLIDELLAGHRRFPAHFDSNAEPRVLFDLSGGLIAANAAALALLDRRHNIVRGTRFARVISRFMGQFEIEAFALARSGRTARLATKIPRPGGSSIALEVSLFPAIVDDTTVGVYACATDVSKRVQNERIRELYLLAANAGHDAESKLELAIENACIRLDCREAIVAEVRGDELVYVHCVGGAQRVGERVPYVGTLEYLATIAGDPIAMSEPAARASIVAPIVVDGRVYGTVSFIGPRSGSFTVEDIDYVRMVSTFATASIDRSRQRRRLSELAFFDTLTGLPNRVQLMECLAATITNSQRQSLPFAVHFFDLDGFKAINDAFGHLRGDSVIALVGKRFERGIGPGNFVARVGGDEFVVIQPAVDGREDAVSLAAALRESLAEPFELEGRMLRISASVGIALYPWHGEDCATLLASADLALYDVKTGGRDAIAFVDDRSA
jgi:diguanylate cyclase (GGDEF)-like protein